MLLISGLLVIEVSAIRKDRREHDIDQAAFSKEQREHFSKIGEGIKQTLTENEAVLKRTQDVAQLTKASLENITAGNSYAVVQPILFERPDRDIPLAIENHGSSILMGVTVVIYDVGVWLWGTHDSIMRSNENRMTIGTLHPRERQVLAKQIKPEQFMKTQDEKDNAIVYHLFVFIAAQNFTAEEYLDFKKDAKGHWNYIYKIYRPPLTTGRINKKAKPQLTRLLEQIDWSMDINNPSNLRISK
jgi:hypothetical protein